MDLLEEPLPSLTLRTDVGPSEFFDRCEVLAGGREYRIDRRRNYAGPGYDQLNLHLGSDKSAPMVRMVVTPHGPNRVDLDVVARWASCPIDYDEYLRVAKDAYGCLFDAYAEVHGVRLRLGVSRRPPRLDMKTVDCRRVEYAMGKFREAVRDMAVGAGDVRERLRAAWLTIYMVEADDLPVPLRQHLTWVQGQLTKCEARHRFEGAVDATVNKMRRSTGVKIAERILALADALDEIHRRCTQEDP